MNKTLLLSFVLTLSQLNYAQVKVDNPLLITKQDKKKEDKREKDRKKKQKAREKKAKKEYKEAKKKEEQAKKEWGDIQAFHSNLAPWTDWYYKNAIPGLLKLAKVRKNLYSNNLFDTYLNRDLKQKTCTNYIFKRHPAGHCNDLQDTSMGSAWTRFGRNTDPKINNKRIYKVLYPNPRTISKELLERDTFKAVDFLNLLAVPWIQYMTHDWFSHGDNEDPAKFEANKELKNYKPFILPLKNDPDGLTKLIFPKSMIDTTKSLDEQFFFQDTFLNEVTHWWDGSQMYGSSIDRSNSLREFKDGRLKVNDDGNMIQNALGMEETGFNRNWWLGLSLLHNLFTKEHNAIAAKLKEAYKGMTDDEIFNKARLINAALIAKIHTVEWTPAIIPHSTLEKAMRANWNGLLNNSGKVKKWFELFKSDFLFGIVGGKKDLAGVPFSMTEEFVSVYRMHPLLPDDLVLTKIADPDYKKEINLEDTREAKSTNIINNNELDDLLYSFGRMNPGQLTLKNYPKTLMNIDIPFFDGKMDLAAMDILRDRERNVPRYNSFREQMGLKKIVKFEDLTPDKEIVKKLKKVYDNDVEALDLLVGCLAEAYRPTGYGFGETAFQVFIVMASRRLIADRFYTENYNEQTYTKVGIDWVDNNNMKTVLLRHFERLGPALEGVKNAFNPWNKLEKETKNANN
jgi:hypothetical protein